MDAARELIKHATLKDLNYLEQALRRWMTEAEAGGNVLAVSWCQQNLSEVLEERESRASSGGA